MDETLNAIGQLIITVIGTLSLLLLRAVQQHAKSISNQVNNVHHEGDEAPSLRELIVWTHADTKETKELAIENRQLIGKVQVEQLRVRDELADVKGKNCPFHDQNTADLSEIKKRLGMSDEPT